MKSAIIGWNLANFVTLMLMIAIIWVITSMGSHFLVRKSGGGKSAPSGFASTAPAAPGATIGGDVTLSLVA